uniref:Uncharacterized protein n=1 Tax=Kalanchoe fedtschenkoi TaxID=63787 RepID=A0A7N0UL44_KALFE
MVFQKRLDYGFSGYQVPPTPRAARSARRRASSFKKKVDENQMCAFDLLATLAGKILLEGEKSVGVGRCEVEQDSKKKQYLPHKSLKVEPHDSSSYQPSLKSTNNVSEVHNPEPTLKLSPPCSIKASSDSGHLGHPIKVKAAAFQPDPLIKPEVDKAIKSEPPVKPAVGVEAGTYSCRKFEVRKLEPEPPPHSGSAANAPPLYGDHATGDTSCVKTVSRDDDEKSSGCTTHPSTLSKPYMSSPPRIVDRRIRKFLAYKYWNVAPKLKDGEEAHHTDVDKQRRCCFRRQRSQRNYPFKKRKMYCHGSLSNSDDGATDKQMPCSNIDAFNSVVGTSSSIMGGNVRFKRRDSHVKLRIKSFRVPELFIEISEMATVSSLKRTVMEAVTAILGDGLRVGVLLHGKKIGDDSKTLLQTGISHDNQLDSVGFSLEPNTSPNPPSLTSANSPHILHSETRQPLTRYVSQEVGRGGAADMPLTSIGNFVESDHDSAPSPDLTVDKYAANSRAIVPVQALKMEAAPAPPPNHRKSKHSEAGQRRIRRPFSVSEVEALVQAVEKLGTGRWRDVKLQAFDNAKHRTYVDLKDKWKTLVHTAKISPQQRRGEPVPQELLDRVLDAHAYWSLQQAKQQLKHQRETRMFLELEPAPAPAAAHNRN